MPVCFTYVFWRDDMSMFKPATRHKLKARIALDGPAGGGKTFTGLRFATAFAQHYGGSIGVIDTEHGSSKKCLGYAPDGVPFQFEVCELVHFAPTTYTAAIQEAGAAGFTVLLIDSLSHAWEGVGGALDTVDKKSSGAGGKFTAWKDVTPMHRQMVEAILAFPGHVIATMRTKMAHEMVETVENGRKKMKVEKIGLKPIQREGMEYEFDLVADLDIEHLMTVSKTRCQALDGARVLQPGAEFLAPFIRWLDEGDEPPAVPAFQQTTGVQLGGQAGQPGEYSMSVTDQCGPELAAQIAGIAQRLGVPIAKLQEIKARHGAAQLMHMPFDAATELHEKLKAMELQQAPFDGGTGGPAS